MKKIYILGALFTVLTAISGCSDEFLKEKQPYGKYNETQVYGNFSSAEERVNYLYYAMLPSSNSGSGNGNKGINDYTSVGVNDPFEKSTLEYGGFSDYVNPDMVLDYTNITDYFYVINKSLSPWGNIRDCNDIIQKLQASSALTEKQRNQLLGQAYFWRAFRYWSMVKLYGGVPIIEVPQSPIVGDTNGEDKIVPRSSTKDCISFICNDLDKAASMLPARWENESKDFGRITTGAALALKGKVLLFYASPLFNRSDDKARWQAAFDANKAALDSLKRGNFGLAYPTTGGEHNGANWARMFMNYEGSDNAGNTEAVLITLFNNHDNNTGNYHKWNNWEHTIRPVNTNGGGGLHPTAEMVDMFPMADGSRPNPLTYNKLKFWMNRDPRFYRTFAFPGEEWRFNENGAQLSSDALSGIYPYSKYPNGSDYCLWSYTWYDKAADQTDVTTGSGAGYSPEKLNNRNSAVYIRKRSDDSKLEETPLYIYSISSSSPKGFQRSAAPIIFMRYAEVLLDYAEAACGIDNKAAAIEALQEIRKRVGYSEGNNNYGLGTLSTREQIFEAILYERQIELAYEGKAFDDARRWMLFDGGAQPFAGAPSTFTLTGFGGNTCKYLGVKPLNGQRRHEIILYATQTAAENEASDPLAALRPVNNKDKTYGLDLTENITDAGLTDSNLRVQNMCNFYEQYLGRKDVNCDGNDESKSIYYRPEYYFLGLKQSAMSTNPSLLQNVGWHDFSHGSDGTFDPLAK